MELTLDGEKNVLIPNLGIWKALRPSWFPHRQASTNEETTERIRILSGKNEDLGDLNVIHMLALPHQEKSKASRNSSRKS